MKDLNEKQLTDLMVNCLENLRDIMKDMDALGYSGSYCSVDGGGMNIVLRSGLEELAEALDRKVKEERWPEVREVSYRNVSIRQYPKEERRRYLRKGEK